MSELEPLPSASTPPSSSGRNVLRHLAELGRAAAVIWGNRRHARRARRRRRSAWRADPWTHRGIELSIELTNGLELVRADSDHLYWIALLAGVNSEGWYELAPGQDEFALKPGTAIRVRMRPRLLADPAYD